VILCRISCLKPVTTANVTKLTIIANEILIIEILTIGRDTFRPFTSDFINFNAMKNSLDNSNQFSFQRYIMLWITWMFLNTLISSCTFGSPKNLANTLNSIGKTSEDSTILLGNSQTEKYLPLLQGKKVAVVSNQTSVIKKHPPS